MIPLMAVGRSDRTDILAGLFVLAVLVLLAAWIVVKVLGQSWQRNDYYAFPMDVTGMRVGTPVMVAGYRVGLVTEIVPQMSTGPDREHEAVQPQTQCLFVNPPPAAGQTYFRLTLAIDKDWPITKDSQVRLETPSLLGQPVIALKLGKDSRLCPGSAIPFEVEPGAPAAPDLAGLTQRANEVLATVDTFLKQLENEKLPANTGQLLSNAQQTVRTLGETAVTMNRFINDQNLQRMKADMGHAVVKLNALLEDARKLVNETRKATGAVQEIRPPLANAATDLEYVLRLTASRLPGILSNLEQTTQDLSGLLADLRADPVTTLRGRDAETPVWTGEPRR